MYVSENTRIERSDDIVREDERTYECGRVAEYSENSNKNTKRSAWKLIVNVFIFE